MQYDNFIEGLPTSALSDASWLPPGGGAAFKQFRAYKPAARSRRSRLGFAA
jgi:hypothetical protein